MDIKRICKELEDLFDIDVELVHIELENYVYRLIDICLFHKDLVLDENFYLLACEELIGYHKKLFDEFEIYEKEEEILEFRSEYVKTGETYMRKLVRRRE